VVAEPLAAPRCRLAESPRWSGDRWWWVDAEVGDVWTAEPTVVGSAAEGAAPTPSPSARRALRLGGRASMVQPAVGGELVVARGASLQRFRRGASQWDGGTEWCRVPVGGGVLNDGTADSHGRLWIGSVAADRSASRGHLYCVDVDGTRHLAATGFALSNGMAWDRATASLLHVDSLARTVWRHRVDARTGEVVGSEPALRLADDDGLPDGIALDAERHLWVAVYGRGEVRRHRPDGTVDLVVDVPTGQVTSVALGGPDGRELLITTAQEG